MATPQRVDPGGPRGDIENPRRTGARSDTPRRRGAFVYWWWGFWIAIFAFAICWGIWGAAGGNGWWFLGSHHVKAPPVNGPGVAALQAPSKQAFVGQKFQANFVPVQKKISSTVYWVGPKNTAPTLLVLKNDPNAKSGEAGPLKKNGTSINPGNLVDITGTMEKAPPQAQAQQQWALNSSDAAQLESQGGYIQGTLVFYVPR
jgi:hypothetical protein